jgi:hypothetical protein
MVASPVRGFKRKYSSSAVVRRSEQSSAVPVREKTMINMPRPHIYAFNDLVYFPN